MNYPLSKIGEETAYPIFLFEVNFTQKRLPDASEWSTKDLPEGRQSNGTSRFGIFYREEVSAEQVQEDLEKWWKKTKLYFETEKGYEDIELVNLNFQYERNEVWVGEWFCHCTPDLGQTDEELLKSFQEYIYRMEDLNRKLRDEQNCSSFSTPKGGICLMAAEDRWRWRNDKDERGVPCRCDGCKKSGIIRFNH